MEEQGKNNIVPLDENGYNSEAFQKRSVVTFTKRERKLLAKGKSVYKLKGGKYTEYSAKENNEDKLKARIKELESENKKLKLGHKQ